LPTDIAPDGDSAVDEFLDVLAKDIERHPERLQFIDSALISRIKALVGHVEVNLYGALAQQNE
jgi:antitoxin PrlF